MYNFFCFQKIIPKKCSNNSNSNKSISVEIAFSLSKNRTSMKRFRTFFK